MKKQHKLRVWRNLVLRLSIDMRVLRPSHGPQVWPWWRLISFAAVYTNPGRQNPDVPAWNVWAYTRWGALVWWFAVDKRIASAVKEVV